MEAKELRIGNLVNHAHLGYLTVETVKHKLIIAEDLNQKLTFVYFFKKDVEPIPLTAELLKRLGFEHRSIHGNLYDKEYKMKRLDNGEYLDKSFTVGVFDDFCVILQCNHMHIKYVHQLQNLYFDMTGIALELKAEAVS
jgi:hypothetical protein